MKINISPDHVQVYAPEIGDYVDWGLIGALREMWGHGIKTHYSCEGPQEPHPFGYLVFENESSASIVVCEALRRWNYRIIKFRHEPLFEDDINRTYVAFERES